MSNQESLAYREEIHALKSENAHLSEVIERLHAYVERLEVLLSQRVKEDHDAPLSPRL
jgi:uncharacterized protein YdcH (DUF465 family)